MSGSEGVPRGRTETAQERRQAFVRRMHASVVEIPAEYARRARTAESAGQFVPSRMRDFVSAGQPMAHLGE